MGLKPSKKFAIGSVHENGGGKFTVLDRWFDEESQNIMLKYEFENGKIEENKEANVNASEWKWRKVRGLAGKKPSDQMSFNTYPSPTGWEEIAEELYVRLENLYNGNEKIIAKIQEESNEEMKMLMDLTRIVQVQQKQIEQLVSDKAIINKLLEKV